jgi:putative transposase
MDEKYFYKRKLPHWQPPDETFFVTYRLAGSLPVSVINSLKENYILLKNQPDDQGTERAGVLREDHFHAFDNALEKNLNEPHWIRNNEVANIIMESLLFNNNKQYTLHCACLMSNHVHTLLSTLPGSKLLNTILQNHKKFTAVQSNKVLGRSGTFWAEESFDTLIRNNAHFWRVVNYILQNPVKAGIVQHWSDYKWTYIHPDLEKIYMLQEDQL